MRCRSTIYVGQRFRKYPMNQHDTFGTGRSSFMNGSRASKLYKPLVKERRLYMEGKPTDEGPNNQSCRMAASRAVAPRNRTDRLLPETFRRNSRCRASGDANKHLRQKTPTGGPARIS